MRVVQPEFRMLQQQGYELTTLTIFRQHFTLRQQQLQGNLLSRLQPAIRADFLAFFAYQIAAYHLQDVQSVSPPQPAKLAQQTRDFIQTRDECLCGIKRKRKSMSQSSQRQRALLR